MKFKKTVSAAAALAMSVSAFAGIGITARAATLLKPLYNNSTGTSAANTTSNIDLSSVDWPSSGKVCITYTVTTTVDYSNTGGDRAGIVTLYSSENNAIFSLYTNTYKNAWGRRYAIGEVATSSSTLIDNSQDNSSDHYFDITLNIDIDNDTLSGSITNSSITAVTLSKSDIDISDLSSFNLESNSSANTISVSNIVISTVTEVAGYTLTTTPYASVTVKGNTYYADSSGVVNFGETVVNNNDTITISKNGYQTLEYTVNDVDTADTKPLTCIAPYEYYEDFSNVNDNFGFDNYASIVDGALCFDTTQGNPESSMTFPTTFNMSGKTLYMKVKSNNANSNANRAINIKLGETNINIHVYGSNVRLTADGTSSGTSAANCSDYIDLAISFSSTNTAVTLYANGKSLGYRSCSNKQLTGLTLETIATTGNTSGAYIDDLRIADTPTTYTATFIDGASTTNGDTYLSGYSYEVTLPAPSTTENFQGWSDGTKTYNSGETVTINNATTFTAIYQTSPTELTADATLASSFIDADKNESQVWEASIEGSAGTTLSKLQATATYTTDSDSNTTLTNSSNELDITNITGEAGVYAAVVLENTQDVNISGVTVTLK